MKKNREYKPMLAMQSNDTAFSTSMFTAGSAFRRALSLSHAVHVNLSVIGNWLMIWRLETMILMVSTRL